MTLAMGIAVALAGLGAFWIIGHGTLAVLQVPAPGVPGARALVGLATALAVLDVLGLWWPVRHSVFALVPLLGWGLVSLVRWPPAPTREGFWSLVLMLGGFALGTWPLFLLGRVGVLSLTNDDAAFYIDAADHLLELPWSSFRPGPAGCLSNLMLHDSNWRTGIPLMMAGTSAVTGLPHPATLPLVRAVLFAMVPVGAWWLMAAFEAPRTLRNLVLAGLASTVSCAVVFVGFQDMTSHLASLAFFPAALGAMSQASRRLHVGLVLQASLVLGAAPA